MVALTTWAKSRPAAASTAPALSSALRVWATTSPASWPVAGSAPTWPDTNTSVPGGQRTPCENGPIGRGADGVDSGMRMVSGVLLMGACSSGGGEVPRKRGGVDVAAGDDEHDAAPGEPLAQRAAQR